MVLGPRFLIEAGFVVAAAAVARLANLSTWAIIGVVAAASIIVALIELAVRARKAPRRGPDPQGPDPGASPEPVVIRTPKPATPEREPEPAAAAVVPREWNLWELERVARDHTTGDLATNEERSYLLMYLREFAGSDGTLPTDFDGLVRDAFGDLLNVVAT